MYQTRIVRSFSPEPGKQLELVLEHSGDSRFFWLENGEYAANQKIIFANYNLKLMLLLGKLERLGRSSLTRLELCNFLGQTKDAVNRYFRVIRPELLGEKCPQKHLPVSMSCVYEMLADFMPILENWETNIEISKRMGMSMFTIADYHRKGRIEARCFMAKVRVSPVGLKQLGGLLRNTAGFVILPCDTYFYPAQIAREAMKVRGEDSAEDKKRFNFFRDRYAFLMRDNQHQLGAVKMLGRWAVKTAIKDKLCDALSKSEAAWELGITVGVLRRIVRKKSVKCYKIGRVQWVSLESCRDYLARSKARFE